MSEKTVNVGDVNLSVADFRDILSALGNELADRELIDRIERIVHGLEPMPVAEGQKKPHISNSQLGMYEGCGEQYRRRYIEKQIIPPGIAMARGSGVHGGARENFVQKVKSHEDLSRDKIVDAAVERFKREIKNGIVLTPDEESIGHEKVVATATDSVAGLAGILADEVVSQYQPIFAEQRHRIVIPGCSHDLVAMMDLADDKDSVIDLKTAAKKKSQRDVDVSEQLTFYALVFKGLTGKLPKDVRFEVLVETPKKQNRYRQVDEETGLPLVSTRTNAALQTLVARINAMIRGLEAGIFIPARSDDWRCSPRWCGYWPICEFRSRR